MTFARMMLAASLISLAFAVGAPSTEAGGFSLRLGGPNFGLGIDTDRDRYPPPYYGPAYPGYPVYDQCDYARDWCRDRWGIGADYRACMRHQGCL